MPVTIASSPRLLTARLRKLRQALAAQKLDGIVILHAPDICHLTGFCGHDSALVVSKKSLVIITDSRYEEEARQNAAGVPIVLRKLGLGTVIAEQLVTLGIRRVGIDGGRTLIALLDSVKARLLELGKSKKFKGRTDVEFVIVNDFLQGLRQVKEPAEVKAIRQASKVAEDAFYAVLPHIKPGTTEGEIAGRLIMEMRSRGATDAAFDPIVGAGANSSKPHYSPDATPVTNNMPLLFDWGALVNGYRSDITRTLLIGKVSKKLEKIYDVVLEAQMKTISKIKAGMTGAEADALARDVIRKAGFGKRFGHGLGHGVGRDIHEEPRLHSSRKKDVLEPGMVVTIEPGIYLPGVGGVRIEDDVVITNKGCDVITTIAKDKKFARSAVQF